MRRSFSRPALIALVCTGALLSACEDDPSAPESPATFEVESDRTARETLGPSGGSIGVTSAAGIQYVLDLPPGALTADCEIEVTPVRSMGALPLSGGLAGGVDLAPEGLLLLVPATLTMTGAAAPDSEQVLIGFKYEGDGAAFDLTPVIPGPTGTRVFVTHFSGAGAGIGTLDDAANEAFGDTPSSRFARGLLALAEGDREGYLQLVRNLLADTEALIARTSGDELRLAVIDFIGITLTVFEDEMTAPYGAQGARDELDEEVQAVVATIVPQLRTAIAAANERCEFQGDPSQIGRVFEFHTLAQILAVDTAANGLDEDTVVRDLCARAVFVRSNLASLPDPCKSAFRTAWTSSSRSASPARSGLPPS